MISAQDAFHASLHLDIVVPLASTSDDTVPFPASLDQFNPEVLFTMEAQLSSNPAACLHGNSPRRPPAEFSG